MARLSRARSSAGVWVAAATSRTTSGERGRAGAPAPSRASCGFAGLACGSEARAPRRAAAPAPAPARAAGPRRPPRRTCRSSASARSRCRRRGRRRRDPRAIGGRGERLPGRRGRLRVAGAGRRAVPACTPTTRRRRRETRVASAKLLDDGAARARLGHRRGERDLGAVHVSDASHSCCRAFDARVAATA